MFGQPLHHCFWQLCIIFFFFFFVKHSINDVSCISKIHPCLVGTSSKPCSNSITIHIKKLLEFRFTGLQWSNSFSGFKDFFVEVARCCISLLHTNYWPKTMFSLKIAPPFYKVPIKFISLGGTSKGMDAINDLTLSSDYVIQQ